MFKWLEYFMALLAKALGWNDEYQTKITYIPRPPEPPKPPLPAPLPPNPKESMNSTIYLVAKESMGKHITLDGNVPPDVGCAEAVSYVLKNAGVQNFPAQGIAGTAQLWEWLKQHAKLVETPVSGAVVISPTGTSTKGVSHGHTGIVMQFGICSNDSNSGLFKENYTQGSWSDLFHTQLGFPVYYFSFD